ncbi:MAG: hypothetical protein PHC50_09035 [Candidatus Cloacimonetes bacterium]|nr:hypothetical protein [Candidatus Cloacimonadota bacterium]
MVFRSWLAVILLAYGVALWAEEPLPSATALPDTLAEAPVAEDESDWIYAEEYKRPEPDKEEILDWIEARQKREAERDRAFVQDAFAPSIYAFGANYTELYSDPYRVSLYGFERFGTLLKRTSYLGAFARHYTPQYRVSTVDYEHTDYPYTVSVSGIKGVLGDYDTRDLSAFFAKQGLLGFEDLALFTDFSLQNGYWLDNPNGGSSLRALISYHTDNWDIRGEYASNKSEPGSRELLPYYRNMGLYRFKHNYAHLYLKAQSPWLELALLRSRDKAQSSSWMQEVKSKGTQISAAKDIEYGAARLGMRYEYADIQRNYGYINSYNQINYRHKLSLELGYDDWVLFEAVPELLDWKYLRSDSRLLKSWGALRLGIYDRRIFNTPDAKDQVLSPFNGDMTLWLVMTQDWESGILGGWQEGALSANLAAAYQKLSQFSISEKRGDKQFILRLYGSYQPRFGDWELEIAPNWNYQDNKLYLMENPRYRFGSRQALTRHLSHDNALSCGFDIQGHSFYYIADAELSYLVEASTMVDLWAKVKVGRLFDFTVRYQNLLNTSLYGVYPIPASIHAGINWYFIN